MTWCLKTHYVRLRALYRAWCANKRQDGTEKAPGACEAPVSGSHDVTGSGPGSRVMRDGAPPAKHHPRGHCHQGGGGTPPW